MRLLIALLLIAGVAGAHDDRTFSTLDVVLDTDDAPLGAYQLDLRFDDARVHLVGVEAGAGFGEAPTYDPKALMGRRVVLASLDLQGPFTSGHVHVATLHVEHPTAVVPRIRAARVVAADSEGRRVPAELLSRVPGGER